MYQGFPNKNEFIQSDLANALYYEEIYVNPHHECHKFLLRK